MTDKIRPVTKEHRYSQRQTNSGHKHNNARIQREARRRFAKMGLLAPFIVTLAGRPAFGMNSGHLSGNLSNAPNNNVLGDMNGFGVDNLGANPYDPYGIYPNDSLNSSNNNF